MRNIRLIIATLPLLLGCTTSGQALSGDDGLRRQAERMIDERQKPVGFDDQLKTKLVQIEYNYLKAAGKAENSKSGNVGREIEKCSDRRDAQLQKLLPRHQYLRYKQIDAGLPDKDVPLWSD